MVSHFSGACCITRCGTVAFRTKANLRRLHVMTYFNMQAQEFAPKAVGIVGFDGVAALDLTGPLDALASASVVGASNERLICYRPLLLGLTTRRFVSESGLPFRAEATLASAGPLDTIIVPGGKGVR